MPNTAILYPVRLGFFPFTHLGSLDLPIQATKVQCCQTLGDGKPSKGPVDPAKIFFGPVMKF